MADSVKSNSNLIYSNLPEAKPPRTRPPSLAEERERLRHGGMTLKAAVAEVVKQSASLLSMRHMGSQERDESGRLKYRGISGEAAQATIRSEIWHSPDGEALRELARSRFAGLEKSKAIAKIEADSKLKEYHARGLAVLRQGRIGLGL